MKKTWSLPSGRGSLCALLLLVPRCANHGMTRARRGMKALRPSWRFSTQVRWASWRPLWCKRVGMARRICVNVSAWRRVPHGRKQPSTSGRARISRWWAQATTCVQRSVRSGVLSRGTSQSSSCLPKREPCSWEECQREVGLIPANGSLPCQTHQLTCGSRAWPVAACRMTWMTETSILRAVRRCRRFHQRISIRAPFASRLSQASSDSPCVCLSQHRQRSSSLRAAPHWPGSRSGTGREQKRWLVTHSWHAASTFTIRAILASIFRNSLRQQYVWTGNASE